MICNFFFFFILFYSSSKGSLAQYLPESRNLLKISDRAKNGRNRYIHKGKTNIINFLEKLPKTKHDIGSFIIDVLLANVSQNNICFYTYKFL